MMPEYPVSHCDHVNFILHATDRMVYNKLVCNYIWILDYSAYSLHCKSKDRLNEEAVPISITPDMRTRETKWIKCQGRVLC